MYIYIYICVCVYTYMYMSLWLSLSLSLYIYIYIYSFLAFVCCVDSHWELLLVAHNRSVSQVLDLCKQEVIQVSKVRSACIERGRQSVFREGDYHPGVSLSPCSGEFGAETLIMRIVIVMIFPIVTTVCSTNNYYRMS